MKQAAGILSVTADGRVLLLKRAGQDHAGEWAFPGGGVESGETPEQAARREFTEETGATYDGPLYLWTRRQRDGVDFWTYLAPEPAEEFAPALNEEHTEARWVPRAEALDSLPIHPGVRVALLKFDMTELDVAKAIRDGELTSPQRFGPMWLFALRITGTGAAYRKGIDEFVWRDPSIYLNERFLERCGGLPVILEHPDNSQPLNAKEFYNRIVGTIMLPYIEGDAVWGIARIYDPAVAKLLEDDVSTSPCVVLRPQDANNKIPIGDQQEILIEGDPLLLDSVAIVGRGVWDQGGPPSGVQRADADDAAHGDTITTSQEDPKMAEEKVTKSEDKTTDTTRADADVTVGAKLDKLLGLVEVLGTKQNELGTAQTALSAAQTALATRMDSVEKGFGSEGRKGERPEADGEDAKCEHGEVKKDCGKCNPAKKDGEKEPGKKESSEQALEEERRRNELARNDAQAAEATALRARLAAIEARLPTDMPDDQRQKFTDAQLRAERVALAFGDSAGAPRHLNGETLIEYRRRLAASYKKYSVAWKDIDLSKLDDATLTVAETQILADALVAASRPSDMPAGVLREVHRQDNAGRRITSFVASDESAAWAPFTFGARPMRINTKPGN